MADIELVIKLDEDIAQGIIDGKNDKPRNIVRSFQATITDAIKKGTPLPKGHGKIKDIDEIEWYGCTTAFDCPYKDRECKDCDKAECSKTQVDDIPTIIEADTESEDKE